MPTPNTGIPYVPENTTDPAAGLNLALNVIDALLQTAVIDMDLTAPPGSPSDGDLHIVGGSATGAWVGEDGNLARYVSEGDFWQFYEAGSQVKLILNLADGGLYKWAESDGWEIVGGLPDAPIDGTAYVRQDGDWVPESGGGGAAAWGSITGTLSDQTDLQAALDAKAPATAPFRSVSAATTTVAGDANGFLYHPAADTTARVWTIDSNANVPYPVGTAITFDNDAGAGALTIAITSDTLVLVGAGTTGSRTLAAGGRATALKVTSTRWRISGSGLT